VKLAPTLQFQPTEGIQGRSNVFPVFQTCDETDAGVLQPLETVSLFGGIVGSEPLRDLIRVTSDGWFE